LVTEPLNGITNLINETGVVESAELMQVMAKELPPHEPRRMIHSEDRVMDFDGEIGPIYIDCNIY